MTPGLHRALCLCALAVLAPAQSKNVRDLAAAKVLVASRDLADPNFGKTVILLVHYDDVSALGLILNRRTEVPLSEVLQKPRVAKSRADPVYLGGPVDTSSVFAILQSSAKIEGASQVLAGLYLIMTKALLDHTIAARPDPSVFRVYLGYAGWTNDQLRREVEQGAWFIFPADASSVFDADPDSLWPRMIRKTEQQMARIPQ